MHHLWGREALQKHACATPLMVHKGGTHGDIQRVLGKERAPGSWKSGIAKEIGYIFFYTPYIVAKLLPLLWLTCLLVSLSNMQLISLSIN